MHADGAGLYLRVLETGTRSWILIFRWRGRRREMGLGGARYVGLTEARIHADAARRMIRFGQDPIDTRRRARGLSPRSGGRRP